MENTHPTAAEYLSVLNPEQRAAVEHSGSPLLILAGAGSGKTRVITTKIAYLIGEKDVDPYSILAVTFTKKAAAEMASRARHLEPRAANTAIRTFHSFGAWFLRLHAQEAGLDPSFTVYDEDDMVTLLTKALPALSRQEASRAVHKISLAKDYCLTPDSPDLAEIDAAENFPDVYRAYQNRLKETGNVDFGDLIMLPVLLLKAHETVKAHMHRRFRVIMVDEYQDSNVAQFELLQQLSGPETYVCVVGDDDQSIYRFRGAEVKNILSFQEHFPGTQIIKLERNYRSLEPILDTANDVISHNTGRLGKTLRAERGTGEKPVLAFLNDQDDETAFCAKLIQDAHAVGVPYADWAILYRTNAQSLGFETEFLHRKIPYTVVGSLKFYEREEIKDALAFLALTANRRNEVAFRRIVNKPSRGIGSKSQDMIVECARRNARESLTGGGSLLDACRESVPGMAKKAKSGLQDFIGIMDELLALIDAEENVSLPLPAERLAAEAAASLGVSAPDNGTASSAENPQSGKKLSEFIELLNTLSGLLDYHTAQDEIAGTQRAANLQELANSAALYPLNRAGLTEFLDHIELDRTIENAGDEDGDAVTLITLHNTKGLEFPRVVITGLESGIFPRTDKQPEEREEERRLFYVGITRARDMLLLTSCRRRRLYGRTDFMEASPFLLEIRRDALQIVGESPATFRRGALNGAADAAESHPLADTWSKGQKVYHDDYGYGIITNAKVSDAEYVVTVQFENGALKQFMPEYQARSLLIIRD
ncbi:ATP-dependent helicase [Treponema brennaborense]|uniref:DNA 3'-5' helicase n=1 Tax=Treponema brennaborense (strain DSM 12168 / CIP 105900 / DD5/3) TaxID=906968 RepID=F4LPF7_TREBD|nr:UvrD-helicase domain-containing protein [Treponema brennaborense]AEE15968.1 UvrD/REP helicase [Treponema brennaborense DSM 12168]